MKNLSLKINWMSIVMLVSLGINFFVIGFLVAQHKAREIRMTRLSFDNQISKLVEPLPRNGRRDFYVTMRSKRDDLIPIYQNIMQQRAAIMEIIAKEQFDPEKLRTAMREYHEIYHQMIMPSQDVMVDIISDLSLEERQAILGRFNNPPRRDRRGRGENDRRREPDSNRW
jgi:uncharacterized membrane protein